MAPVWNVMALKMGELEVETSVILSGTDYGKRTVIPIWATAIYGNGRKILVDTGIDECEWIRKELGPCFREQDENIVYSIKKYLKWDTNDVDTVLNTHLHHDHCGENRSFRNARFYVQQAEYEAALQPFETQKCLYKTELMDKNAVNYFDWIFLNGESEILPGIKVIPTPGHSKGHQSVLVNTAEGTLCIVGDAAHLTKNINENIPASLVLDITQYMSSLALIRKKADFILSGHEQSISNGQTKAFPKILKK